MTPSSFSPSSKRRLIAGLSGWIWLTCTCAGAGLEPAVRGMPIDHPQAELSAVWVGHATVLIRMGKRHILTDPNLAQRLLILSRDTPASMTPQQLPKASAILISHLHLDHYDRWSLQQLPYQGKVVFPDGAQPYATNLKHLRGYLAPHESVHVDGLKITAVPVSHFGGRYGIDALWDRSYAGYIIEDGKHRVFFAGDTGYDEQIFKDIKERYGKIDLALIPIAPYRGDSGNSVHVNPAEALKIFADIGADYMIPIHYEAFYGMFGNYALPRKDLNKATKEAGLQKKVYALKTGERWVLGRRGQTPLVISEKDESFQYAQSH